MLLVLSAMEPSGPYSFKQSSREHALQAFSMIHDGSLFVISRTRSLERDEELHRDK